MNPNGSLKWSFPYGSIGAPSIGADGTIYVGTGDNNLHAFNPNGTVKWSYAADNLFQTCPVIGSDGTLYIGNQDTNIYAIK